MSRTKRYLQTKAVERMPRPALNMIGKAVLQGVDRAVEDRWDRALQAAAEAEGDTIDQRVKSISRRFRRELSVVGAASGAVAAAPGIGTGAAAGALVADMGWFAMRATDLIMTIGAAHGHTTSTADERRAWVLSILAFGEEAAEQFSSLLDEVDAGALIEGERVSARVAGLAGSDVATLEAIRRINAGLAGKVITKYGSRRTLLAVGKLLPFGIGAVVGGSGNYALTRVVGSQAAKFFARYHALLPSSLPGFQPPPPGTAPAPAVMPPPPVAGSPRLPNPPAKLSKSERRNSIPTDGRKV